MLTAGGPAGQRGMGGSRAVLGRVPHLTECEDEDWEVAHMAQRLYSMADDIGHVRPRVLVHALSGGMDAGRASTLVARHLLGALGVRRIATFEPDEFVDYRSHRPPMVFSDSTWTDYSEPTIAVDLLRDDDGEDVLLLHGPEPDLRWSGFAAAVVDLVEYFDVELTVGVQGIPMAVPHTRPTMVTAHATRAELVAEPPAETFGTLQVPGSVPALVELTLGRRGHDALGFTAHVPHYLAHSDFPQASAELVRQVSRRAGLALPLGDLEAAASETAHEIARQVKESAEVSAVVTALERQYDAVAGGDARQPGPSLLTQPQAVPSAEEIGAELEAFLAERGDDDLADDGGPRGEA